MLHQRSKFIYKIFAIMSQHFRVLHKNENYKFPIFKNKELINNISVKGKGESRRTGSQIKEIKHQYGMETHEYEAGLKSNLTIIFSIFNNLCGDLFSLKLGETFTGCVETKEENSNSRIFND